MMSAWREQMAATIAILSLTLLLPLTAFLVSVWLLGWQLQSVQSGSMAPTYPVGSLVVVGPLNASQVEVGMPIVFEDPQLPGRLVTHRVIGQLAGDPISFVTQGDANTVRDPFAVPARQVRGHVLWHVSHLGNLMDFLQWPRSFLILVVVPAALLVASNFKRRKDVAMDTA
jgi:signal peptidase